VAQLVVDLADGTHVVDVETVKSDACDTSPMVTSTPVIEAYKIKDITTAEINRVHFPLESSSSSSSSSD